MSSVCHLSPLALQGMGGQHHYFGLWVAADFGKGHSKAKPACTTYSSPQLSAQEDFQFEKMEVWGLGLISPQVVPFLITWIMPLHLWNETCLTYFLTEFEDLEIPHTSLTFCAF